MKTYLEPLQHGTEEAKQCPTPVPEVSKGGPVVEQNMINRNSKIKNPKSKILLDCRLLSKKPTGISRYTEEVLKALTKEFGRENILVLVNADFRKYDDYRTIVTKLKPYNPIHFLLLPFFINRLEFEIYYSTFYAGLYWISKKRKQIGTVHDLMYLRIENYFSRFGLINYLYRTVFNLIVKSTLRASDLTISVSKTTQNDLVDYFHENSTVIGEGVNCLKEIPESEAKTLARFNVEKEKYFLYVGNFRPQKNTSFLIEAFNKSNTSFKLLMVGNTQSMQHQNKNIQFAGILEDHEIQTLYRNCLAFVMPSLYEGFGLPILEAYCAGARVFSSDRGALKEFQDLKISYFSPTNQAELVHLLQNAENIAKQSDEEIERVKEIYSWKRQTNHLMHAIKFHG